MITTYMKIDLSGIDRANKAMDRTAENGAMEIGNAVVKHINDNWFPASPSPRGGPPAKVSGNLERSAIVQGRDPSGRFARGKDVKGATIRYRAKYAARLELGDLERPFLTPALMQIAEQAGYFFRQVARTEFK